MYAQSGSDSDADAEEQQDELAPLPRDVPEPQRIPVAQRLESIMSMVAALLQADIQGVCDTLPEDDGVVEPGVCRGGSGDGFAVRDLVRDLLSIVPPEPEAEVET